MIRLTRGHVLLSELLGLSFIDGHFSGVGGLDTGSVERVRGLIEGDTVISTGKIDLDGIGSLVRDVDLFIGVTVEDLNSQDSSNRWFGIRIEHIIILSNQRVGVNIARGHNL